MVNLTRIYTKTGDDGTTSLGDMSRTSKNDPRLEAYATVDEANSTIGVVLATDELADDVRALLVRIQNDLFDVGADLCTPVVDAPAFEPLRVLESQIVYLEERIDFYNKDLDFSQKVGFVDFDGIYMGIQFYISNDIYEIVIDKSYVLVGEYRKIGEIT